MLVAYAGAAGSAMLFLFLFIFVIIAGSGLFAYVSHCFLVVVEQTGTGNDEVTWPDELYLDWVWRGATMAWLLLFWLAPLGMILHGQYRDILSEDPALALLLAGGVLWLFFPVGILSALLGNSLWIVLHFQALRALCRKPLTTLAFYVASFLVIAAGIVPWYVAMTVSGWLIPLASAMGAAALLIYARLLGRLVWIATTRKGGKSRRKKKRNDEGGEALPPLIAERPLAQAQRTTDGYDLAGDEPMPAGVQEQAREKDRDGYGLADDPHEEEKKAQDLSRDLMEPTRLRLESAQFQLANPQPPRSLLGGVYSFPFYDRTLTPWIRLSAWGTLVGILISLMLAGI